MSRRSLFPIIAVLVVLGTGCQEKKTNEVADTSAGAVRANAAAVNAMASKGFEMPTAIAGHLTLADAEIFEEVARAGFARAGLALGCHGAACISLIAAASARARSA